MSSLTKESDNPREKVRKASGDLYDTKTSLVTTTYTVVKEGNTDMVDKKGIQKLMWWRKLSLLLFQEKRRLTQSTKQRNHKHQINHLIHPKAIKSNFSKSIDKSRSTQITDTVNTVDKIKVYSIK